MIKIFKKKESKESESDLISNNSPVVDKTIKEQTKEIFLELKPTQDIAIQKVIDSHLILLDSLDDYSLYLSCVDQVLQNLHYGLDEATDEKQEKLLRKQSTIIISSLLLKLQAQFLAMKKQTRADAQELLRYSDQQYVTAVISTLSYTSLSKEVVKQGVAQLKSKMTEQKENGVETYLLFDSVKLFTGYQRKKKQYFKVFNEMFEKFYRNRNLLGDSLALSEYIYNHEKDLTDYYVKGQKIRGRIWKIFAVIFIFIATVVLIEYFFYTNVFLFFSGSESASTSDFAYKEFVLIGIAVTPFLYYKIKYWIMKSRIRKKYHKIADALSPTFNSK
jgi:hypothetical protein